MADASSLAGDLEVRRHERGVLESALATFEGINRLITERGIACVDFSDIRFVLRNAGLAAAATGSGRGASRVDAAVAQALARFQDQGVALGDGRRACVSILGGCDVGVADLDAVGSAMHDHLAPDCCLVAGLRFNGRDDDALELRILVTEFSASRPISNC